MTDRRDTYRPDEGRRDIHLDDIVRGVGSFISLVAEVVESVGSAVNQPASAGGALDTFAPTRLPAGSPVSGVRDPLVELFDEGDEIVVVIDWPYAAENQIQVEVQDDVLAVTIGGEFPHTTELLLPAAVDPASLRRTHRNGMTEVRLTRSE